MVYDDLKLKFDQDGFVIINDFLSEKEVRDLKNAGEKLTRNVPADSKTVFLSNNVKQPTNDYFIESADKISYFYEKDALDENGALMIDSSLALNKAGHALHRLHPVFEAFTYNDKVATICRALGLVKPVVMQSMYIYKNPGVGSEVIPHQDASFIWTEPDTLIGFWIALDDAMIENGCLWLIPGSHKNPNVYKRFVRNPDQCATNRFIFEGTIPEFEPLSYVPAVVKKGSLVLIHGKVMHKSEHNKSEFSRHAYAFHIFDQGVSQYSDQNWLQTKVGFKPLYTLCGE